VSAHRERDALTARQERILYALCREYLASGGAVSSGGLRRGHGLQWSPATIRAELATLEHEGYLHKPHHSAGRLPSARGIKRYVASLTLSGRPSPEFATAVDLSLGGSVTSPDDGMRAAVRLLSQVVGCVAVSFVGTSRVGRIGRLDLVQLVGLRALVTVSMDDGRRAVHAVTLGSLGGVGGSERDAAMVLGKVQERLRWLCEGRTLAEARELLLALLAKEEARLDRLLAEALRVGLGVCTAAAMDQLRVEVAGQSSLSASSGEAGAEPLTEVLTLLDDYHLLAEVLCQLLPEPEDEASPRAEVCVGGLRDPAASAVDVGWGGSLPGFALIGCRLPRTPVSAGSDASTKGGLALLGSDRMDYESVIPLIEYAARALASRMCA
jgi:heat-inducible transcriptional repressor